MTAHSYDSRYDFHEPTDEKVALEKRILDLMRDGKRRSKKEIRDALGLDADVEIGARIRHLRSVDGGAFPFSDSRRDGADPDGVYRWSLNL